MKGKKMQWLIKAIAFFFLCVMTQCLAMRDPTQPPAEQLAKIGSTEDKRFVVNSILHGPGRHHVVINGEVLKVGDTISGAKVLKIEQNQVQLIEGTTVIQVPIYKKIKERS